MRLECRVDQRSWDQLPASSIRDLLITQMEVTFSPLKTLKTPKKGHWDEPGGDRFFGCDIFRGKFWEEWIVWIIYDWMDSWWMLESKYVTSDDSKVDNLFFQQNNMLHLQGRFGTTDLIFSKWAGVSLCEWIASCVSLAEIQPESKQNAFTSHCLAGCWELRNRSITRVSQEVSKRLVGYNPNICHL